MSQAIDSGGSFNYYTRMNSIAMLILLEDPAHFCIQVCKGSSVNFLKLLSMCAKGPQSIFSTYQVF